MTPPSKYLMDSDDWFEKKSDSDIGWSEESGYYFIPEGTVDVDAALYLAYKAGMCLAYYQWEKHNHHDATLTHKDRSEYFWNAAQKVGGRS